MLPFLSDETQRPTTEDIERTAREMVDRHGSAATAVLRERVAALETAARWREHATALRVLSLIERTV